MSRYIDADGIQYTMLYKENWITNTGVKKQGVWKDDIDKIPTADVRENVKAHWIDMKPTGDNRFMCSRCKGKEKVPTIMGEPIVWDYCPNCGAEMRQVAGKLKNSEDSTLSTR